MLRKKRRYTSYFVSLLIFVGCLFLLSAPYLFREGQSFLPGDDAYLLMRIAKKPQIYDSLSYGGRFAPYAFGLPLVLSINPSVLSVLLPYLLGMLTFLLFVALLDYFGFHNKNLALAVMITSPTFIYLFGTLNHHAFPVFLSLLGFYLLTRANRICFASIVPFSLMPLFDFTTSAIVLFLLFLYAIFEIKRAERKLVLEKRITYYTIVLLMSLIASLYYGFFIKNVGFERLLFHTTATGVNHTLQQIISEFGSKFGISIFGLILAVLGILSKWNKKYSNLFVFFAFFSLLFLTIFKIEAIFFLNFFISAFAAQGISYLISSHWESKMLRYFTLLSLVCGLLFSCVAFTNRLVGSLPDEGIIRGMGYLSSLPEGVVFSDYSRGHWISYSGKKNVMDSNFRFAPHVNERWADSQTLFYTRDLTNATHIINKYGINYIWIDAEMKKSIWKGEEEGLLFLLKYAPNMRRIYNYGDVEIWKVTSLGEGL